MKNICVMCIGNILLLDEGIGPAVAKKLLEEYEFPENVDVKDCATMGLALVGEFKKYDLIVCVDALDGTGHEPGTVMRYNPNDIARRQSSPTAHDMTFRDVIDAVALLGYPTEGICVGIQIENMNPAELTIGLTPKVEAALPLAVETVLAILVSEGVDKIVNKSTGKFVAAPESVS